MKRILCVAVLMGLTNALHAVTYTWNKTENVFRTEEGTKIGAYTGLTRLVISVTYAGTTSDIHHQYFAFQQKKANGSTTDLLRMKVFQQGDLDAHRANYIVESKSLTGDAIWSEARAGSSGAQITTVFTFVGEGNGVFSALRVAHTFKNPGELVTLYDSASSPLSWSFDSNGKSFDQLVALDGTEILAASIEVDDTPLVPEPGLLALLALGGAGLVLRRKVRA